jgi:hypothetical protein
LAGQIVLFSLDDFVCIEWPLQDILIFLLLELACVNLQAACIQLRNIKIFNPNGGGLNPGINWIRGS